VRRLSIVLSILLVSAPALADDVEAARKKFAEGVRLYQKGDFEGARQLFVQANAEHHAAPIVYNLALAEEKLGHAQAAIDDYESYVAEAGSTGEYISAATVALAEIKSRSTKLRVESKPPGAHVVVDGVVLRDPAPATIFVASGHHLVVVQGDAWSDQKEIETHGGGESLVVALAAPEKVEPVVALPPVVVEEPVTAPPPDSVRHQEPLPLPEEGPDGLVWGASFAIVPCYMLGVTTSSASNARPGASILAGPTLDFGLAITDRFELMARGFVGIGPDAKPSYGWTIGPGLSFHVAKPVWLGATFIAGQIETKAHGERYGTDQVFGTTLEASVVVIDKPSGQWLASIEPSFLLTEMKADNTTFFFPLAFGYRGF
jgi:hypothetical protein